MWTARGLQPRRAAPRASVFFVHPTSFLESIAWNAPLDHGESRNLAELFVRSQASAFNGVGAIWAPRYRQATFGAFLTNNDNARRALDLAYRDVVAAYEQFLREAPADRPIILAAHSQGSMHLMRLLQERIRNAPEAGRIAAVYLVGWPVSLSADLPALPFPACQSRDSGALRRLLDELCRARRSEPDPGGLGRDERPGRRPARHGHALHQSAHRHPQRRPRARTAIPAP